MIHWDIFLFMFNKDIRLEFLNFYIDTFEKLIQLTSEMQQSANDMLVNCYSVEALGSLQRVVMLMPSYSF